MVGGRCHIQKTIAAADAEFKLSGADKAVYTSNDDLSLLMEDSEEDLVEGLITKPVLQWGINL